MLIVANAGSSSLKLAVYEDAASPPVASARVEEIGGVATLKAAGPRKTVEVRDHCEALSAALSALSLDPAQLRAAGHRIVHGGQAFSAPALLTQDVRAALEALSPLAPLHNPPALAVIDAVAALVPDAPQIACFDTAFHAGQPEVAARFAIPQATGLRRYGFHGLSYEGLVAAIPSIIGARLPARILGLHLGNGASVCAIREGRGVATSMGMTPLDGLTMGTRCGAIDPAAVLALTRMHGIDGAEHLLTRESGLMGLSGLSSDMRVLEDAGTEEAAFAIEHFCYWAARHAGSMIAAMGGVDLIAFTGGIGENATDVRMRIAALLAWTGAPVVTVSADEEGVIARATEKLLLGA